MNNESIIIIAILSVLATAILGCLLFIGRQIKEELTKKRRLQEVALYTEMFKNVDGVYTLLDSYINERLAEYKLFNSDKFNKATSAQQTEIARELTIDVLDNMSPAFITQLSMVFNPDKDKIHKLVNNRVVMAVIADSLGQDNSDSIMEVI